MMRKQGVKFSRDPNKNHMTPQAELLNYKGMKIFSLHLVRTLPS